MSIKRQLRNLTNIQQQQKILHYKSEAKKYKTMIDEMKQKYDTNKMVETVAENEKLLEEKTKIEKDYQDLLGKYLEMENGSKKIGEQKNQFEESLSELEKMNHSLMDEKDQWNNEKDDYLSQIESLKVKVEKLESINNTTNDNNRVDDKSKQKKNPFIDNKSPIVDEETAQNDNKPENFFLNFQRRRNDYKND